MKYCPKCEKSWVESFSFCPDDAAPLSAQLPDPLIDKIINGKYQLIEKVGVGRIATVYKGKHLILDDWRAIKLFRPFENQEIENRFKRKVVKIQTLTSDNTVRVFDLDRNENQYFLVEEFVESESLEHSLRAQRQFSPSQAVSILLQICSSLEEAHRQGIFHSNLRPSNVLQCSKKNFLGELVKVSDFEVFDSRPYQQKDSKEDSIYVAPEAGTADPLNAKSDIFSLGVIFYQLITGQLPPEEIRRTYRLNEKSQQKIRGILSTAGVGEPFVRLIIDMLGFNPAGRPTLNQIRMTLDALGRKPELPQAEQIELPPQVVSQDDSRTQVSVGSHLSLSPEKSPEAELPEVKVNKEMEISLQRQKTREESFSPEQPVPSIERRPEKQRLAGVKPRRKFGIALAGLASLSILGILAFQKRTALGGLIGNLEGGNDFLSLFLLICVGLLVAIYVYSFKTSTSRKAGFPNLIPAPEKARPVVQKIELTRSVPSAEARPSPGPPSITAPKFSSPQVGKWANFKEDLRSLLQKPRNPINKDRDAVVSIRGGPRVVREKLSWSEIVPLLRPKLKSPETQASLFHYIKQRESNESQRPMSPELIELLARQPKLGSPSVITSLFGDFGALGQDIRKLQRRRALTATLSFSVHGLVIVAIIIGLLGGAGIVRPEKLSPQQVSYLVEPVLLMTQPGPSKDGGGGGGGGKHERTPPSPGRIPKTSQIQLVPPNPNAQPMTSKDTLIAEPSVVVPIEIPQDKSLPIGDITAPPEPIKTASGPGADGGIGTGRGTGVGPGRGAGVGPGSGGGIGGGEGGGVGSGHGPYIAGYNGVRAPVALFQPYPPYTDEARKSKIEGVVTLKIVVKKDGRADQIRIVRGLGYGLDESAVRTVGTQWRFQPGTLNGQPVDVQATVEVKFSLL